MPLVRDFRFYPYSPPRIEHCGRTIGRTLYWKLYTIENTIRIVIHSVLTAQINANWWNIAVDQTVVRNASRFRASYASRPRNANPGLNDIHLVFLSDLTNIIRSNSHLFIPVIPDTNNWIAMLESIRVPRNLVGHMNFPNVFDAAAINSTFSQLPKLLGSLNAKNVPIIMPR